MPPPPEATVEAVELLAEAWLLRKIRGGKITIVPGYMFKTERAARAAAVRLTNQWWLCQAFPVASLANISRITPTVSREGQREVETSKLERDMSFTAGVEAAAQICDRFVRIGTTSPYWNNNEIQMFRDAAEQIRALPAPPQHGEDVA